MHATTQRLFKAASDIKNINAPSELARFLNVSQQVIKNWETRGVSARMIPEISEQLGISVRWLRTGDGEMTGGVEHEIESNATVIGTLDVWDSKTPLSADDCEVPFYKDIHLSAGNGFSDDIEDYNGYKLRFSKSTLRRHGINPADVVCVCADGDSMEPVFPDGATLGINTADKVIKDGKIYAVNHGGLLRTKILQKLPDNKIRIKSYNSEAYPDEEADADEMNIIGRVFWWSVIA
jgi:phage repressor protein C with HTH and peptisase S24 domain